LNVFRNYGKLARMNHHKIVGIFFAPILAAVALLLATCTASTGPQAPATTTTPTEQSPTAAPPETFAGIPDEARVSTGGGGPRPPAYWAEWNTCAPDSRADEAAANGGRGAGWILVDDLLADPGVQLGDHLLGTCDEAVALLQGRTAGGGETSDPAYQLAAQLLAAELNLIAGAENCPIAEEVVFGAHLILSTSGFDGTRTSLLDPEAYGAAPQLTELLRAYNLGELCQ
jgi:hypothetical protein